VTRFEQDEQLSREQAAERLVDIAYALTAGGMLELRASGARVSVPVADAVLLRRESRSQGDGVHVEVVVSWSA
jgi:amphi-Trp domain-containing protein